MKKTVLQIGSILIVLMLALGGIMPNFPGGNAPDPSKCAAIGHHDNDPVKALALLDQLIAEIVNKISSGAGGVKISIAANFIWATWGKDGIMAANGTNPTIFNVGGSPASVKNYRDDKLNRGKDVSKASELRWMLGWLMNCRKAFLDANPQLTPKAIPIPQGVIEKPSIPMMEKESASRLFTGTLILSAIVAITMALALANQWKYVGIGSLAFAAGVFIVFYVLPNTLLV